MIARCLPQNGLFVIDVSKIPGNCLPILPRCTARRTVLFDDLALRQIMRREFDCDVGKEEYTLTKRIK